MIDQNKQTIMIRRKEIQIQKQRKISKTIMIINFFGIVLMMFLIRYFQKELFHMHHDSTVLLFFFIISAFGLIYSLAFFIWNLILLIFFFINKVKSRPFLVSGIIIMILGICIPLFLVTYAFILLNS